MPIFLYFEGEKGGGKLMIRHDVCLVPVGMGTKLADWLARWIHSLVVIVVLVEQVFGRASCGV
jgi:hypothetical protein